VAEPFHCLPRLTLGGKGREETGKDLEIEGEDRALVVEEEAVDRNTDLARVDRQVNHHPALAHGEAGVGVPDVRPALRDRVPAAFPGLPRIPPAVEQIHDVPAGTAGESPRRMLIQFLPLEEFVPGGFGRDGPHVRGQAIVYAETCFGWYRSRPQRRLTAS
jgi:hypothetical protein